MLLATYQVMDYLTYKNPRYSNLKKLLGISEEKNIFWCMPANSLEQLMIFSFLMCPNQPHKLIIFETDDYYKVDGIKHDYYVEKDPDNSDNEDILKIEYQNTMEYVVTDIPEHRFEVPSLFGKLAASVEDIDADTLMGKCLFGAFHEIMVFFNENDIVKKVYPFFPDMARKAYGVNRRFPKVLVDLRYEYLFYISYVLPFLYSAAVRYLGYDMGECAMKFILSPEDIFLIYNQCQAHNYESMDILNNSYNHAAEKIYESFFNQSGNSDMPKIYPNDPCPCGSGKKYKKCCQMKGSVKAYDINQIMQLNSPKYKKCIQEA